MKKNVLSKLSLCAVALFLVFNALSARSIYLFIGEKNKESIFGRITDTKGRPIIARAELWYRDINEVKEELGKPTPDADKYRRLLFHSDISTEKGWYHLIGFPGKYILRISKGPEWEIKEIPLDIHMINRKDQQQWGDESQLPELGGRKINVTLKRLYNMQHYGWFPGDTHHHTFYSDGRNTMEDLYYASLGGGLSWACATDHNTIAQNEIWVEYASKKFLPIPGNEVTTNAWPDDRVPTRRKGYGHHNYFGYEVGDKMIGATDADNPVLWDRYRWNHYQQAQDAIDEVHAYGGVWQINHTIFGRDWADGTISMWGELKNYDAVEIWNGENPPFTANLETLLNPDNLFALNTMSTQCWMELLNAGNKVAGWGSSDSHDCTGLTYGSKAPIRYKGVTGFSTTYVKSGKLTWPNVKKGLKNGNCFITAGTFGPLVLVKANKKYDVGDIVMPIVKGQEKDDDDDDDDKNMKGKKRYVDVSIKILSNRKLKGYENGIRIVKDGKIYKEFATKEGAMVQRVKCKVEIDSMKDTWFLVMVFGEYPSTAITNPVFVDADCDGNWGADEWTFPKGSIKWANPWPQTPDLTMPDGPNHPPFDLPPSVVTMDTPLNIDDYLNPDGSLK